MTIDPNRIRNGLILAIEAIAPNLFIALVFNRDGVTLEAGARSVEEFFKRLEHEAHGKRWAAYPRSERLKGYAFPEHMESNLHFHIAAHGSERMCEVALEEAHAIWRRLTGTGHADAQLANSPRAVARYITKATRDPRSIGNFVAYAPTPTVK